VNDAKNIGNQKTYRKSNAVESPWNQSGE